MKSIGADGPIRKMGRKPKASGGIHGSGRRTTSRPGNMAERICGNGCCSCLTIRIDRGNYWRNTRRSYRITISKRFPGYPNNHHRQTAHRLVTIGEQGHHNDNITTCRVASSHLAHRRVKRVSDTPRTTRPNHQGGCSTIAPCRRAGAAAW
jgi:hypothetical protein